eukprot:CAMPEP_0172157906 /NCGR_PEP_ID=MMETSP1050-20130122/4069_1 /TAXON_ID=233186 /ORGANISM="Cryptomonas curvata, Strain CCAP979/52" /LENGTH=202 /DNA_ID=CAMNT_0012827223 /DNA_START=11 /DNA_END=616 /DNA_ORIENTATION=-
MAKKSKGSIKSQNRRVAVDWNSLSQAQKFTRVFAIFKSITAGGADGSILGVNGSVNGVSTKLILDSLRVNGKVVCDIGAADGKFMVCSSLAGARQVVGVEFAENLGYKMVLEAVVQRMKLEYDIEFNLDWIGSAIEDFERVPGKPNCVYAYWNGMAPSTQNHVLEICARTSSVSSIAVFYNANWTSPDAVIESLNAFSDDKW